MDGQCATPTASGRREPVSITLADLSALVVGAAFAVSLPQMHWPTDRIAIVNYPMPGWVVWLFVIEEAAMKVAFALFPVILARRARYGGLPRPAGCLTILVGLALLHEVVQRLEWPKRLARWYFVDLRLWLGYPVSFSADQSVRGGRDIGGGVFVLGYDGFPADFELGDEYLLWGRFAAILTLPLFLVLLVGWKRMPGWTKTALLAMVAFTGPVMLTYLGSPGLKWAFHAVAGQEAYSSEIVGQIASAIASAPEGLLFGVLVVAVLVEIRNGKTSRWVWTEAIGAATAALALATGMVIYWYTGLVTGLDPLASMQLTVNALRLVVVALSSWSIVDRTAWAGTQSRRR